MQRSRCLAFLFSRPFCSATPSNELLKKAVIQPTSLKPHLDRTLYVDDYFRLNELVTVRDMHKARVHFGHKIGTVNNKMKWALHGERLNVCIFDLNITRAYLVKALNFVAHIASRGGIILFVTSDRNNMLLVEEMAKSAGEYAHVRRWQESTLTDSMKIFGTAVLETHPAVIEAAKECIPTIGIVDSNSDPSFITYPVPGNDDSTTSIRYFMDLFIAVIKRGKAARVALRDDKS